MEEDDGEEHLCVRLLRRARFLLMVVPTIPQKFMVGLNFADKDEALLFSRAVETKVTARKNSKRVFLCLQQHCRSG